MKRWWTAALVPLATIAALRVGPEKTIRTTAPAPDTLRAAIIEAVERLTFLGDSGQRSAATQQNLRAWYAAHAFEPLWLDSARQPTTGAHVLIEALEHIDERGLDPRDYQVDQWARAARALDAKGDSDARARAELDVGLSLALLRALSDLRSGRVDPSQRGVHFGSPGKAFDALPLAEAAQASGTIEEALAAAEPRWTQYHRLEAALARYRALAGDSLLTPIPAMRTPIQLGERLPIAFLLRRRLAALGDLPAEDSAVSDSGMYTASLGAAIRSFQARHAMDSDAVIGAATLTALRAPLSGDIQKLELALERLRWIPDADAGRVLVVNIPAFRLWALDSATSAVRPALAMNVVVGQAVRRKTPMIDAVMRSVVFRPHWDVPLSIVRREIIPAVRHDPQYLEENDMQLVSASGAVLPDSVAAPGYLAELHAGTIGVRQRPGPKDALGLIKFVILNNENIYLHDTPFPELFARPRRDFSHGCIRVQDPVGLALYVLRDDTSWTRDRILAETAGDTSAEIALPHPVRVLIFYTTAVVWPDGRVGLYPDVYGYDRRLEETLQGHQIVVRGDS